MSEFTKDDALAFVDSLRLTLGDRVGFKWLAERLAVLREYVESIASENERMSAYIDSTHARADYESFDQRTSDETPKSEAQ